MAYFDDAVRNGPPLRGAYDPETLEGLSPKSAGVARGWFMLFVDLAFGPALDSVRPKLQAALRPVIGGH